MKGTVNSMDSLQAETTRTHLKVDSSLTLSAREHTAQGNWASLVRGCEEESLLELRLQLADLEEVLRNFSRF